MKRRVSQLSGLREERPKEKRYLIEFINETESGSFQYMEFRIFDEFTTDKISYLLSFSSQSFMGWCYLL